MKRCNVCGRMGTRGMTATHNRWTGRVDGWHCTSSRACIRRTNELGRWTGKRVLRRIDKDGTNWKIFRSAAGTYVLQMRYREHSMSTTGLLTIEAAKMHADDVVASLAAKSLREYARSR